MAIDLYTLEVRKRHHHAPRFTIPQICSHVIWVNSPFFIHSLRPSSSLSPTTSQFPVSRQFSITLPNPPLPFRLTLNVMLLEKHVWNPKLSVITDLQDGIRLYALLCLQPWSPSHLPLISPGNEQRFLLFSRYS